MNKESLIIARNVIIKALKETKMCEVDRVELMLNINAFLKEEEYNENIKILRKKNKNGI